VLIEHARLLDRGESVEGEDDKHGVKVLVKTARLITGELSNKQANPPGAVSLQSTSHNARSLTLTIIKTLGEENKNLPKKGMYRNLCLEDIRSILTRAEHL
jgi:hypothetical protein